MWLLVFLFQAVLKWVHSHMNYLEDAGLCIDMTLSSYPRSIWLIHSENLQCLGCFTRMFKWIDITYKEFTFIGKYQYLFLFHTWIYFFLETVQDYLTILRSPYYLPLYYICPLLIGWKLPMNWEVSNLKGCGVSWFVSSLLIDFSFLVIWEWTAGMER